MRCTASVVPRRGVGDAGGRDREPGEKEGRIAQRAIIGVRGPAGADQPTASVAWKGGGVDPELLTAIARVGEVRGLRPFGHREIELVQRSEPCGLTGHRRREQLDCHAADGDRRADVGG
jgi:hypothetical protein